MIATMFPGYTLPEELKLLREQVRRFVRDEILPVVDQWAKLVSRFAR